MSHGRESYYADMSVFDFLPHTPLVGDRSESDLLRRVREIVEELPEHLKEIWYMRYVDRMSYRRIATELGYNSHWVIQAYVEQIHERIREGLSEDTVGEPGVPVRPDNDA